MLLIPATEADFPAIVALANLAYRGEGTSESWNIEAGIIAGTRLTESLLQEDLAAKPSARLLLYREAPQGPPLGTVWLEPESPETWYLGLLTIAPSLQNRQLGRQLLAAAEDFARAHGAQRMRMTVLNVREALIAWYQRRGYTLTGETQPYPYGDNRFGIPLRPDLHFLILQKHL